MNRSRALRLSLAIALASGLAACQQAKAPAPAESESHLAGPESKPGLSASNGVLMLPAVAGRPAAAYFILSNTGDKAVELAGVHVAGAARAEMHETVGGSMAKRESIPVKPGETIAFERGGRHVMAFALDDTLKPGGKTELTLIFADGDKLSMPLRIEAMGSAGAMNHGGDH